MRVEPLNLIQPESDSWRDGRDPRSTPKPSQNGGNSIVRRLLPSLRFLFTTEAHVYAFSIAANALLTFFPFALILLTVCRRLLHWNGAYDVIVQLLRANLPVGAGFVIRNLSALVQGRSRIQVVSILMMFFTSSGIFLPLEVALNKVYGIQRNRGFLHNQLVSFLLALASGVLALAAILLTAAAQWLVGTVLRWFPLVKAVMFRGIVEVFSIPLLVSLFFVIYYVAPNGKVPVKRVFVAAVLAGVLTAAAKFIYLLSLPMLKFREVYGPFTLSVTLLFWAFIGALILLFGAHLSAQGLWDHQPAGGLSLASPGQSREVSKVDRRKD